MTTTSSISLAKSSLRKELIHRLRSLSCEDRIKQSQIVTDMVIKSPEYQQSQRISIYLSMNEEVSTKELLDHILKTGRQCFVPRYTKYNMEMLELYSLEDYENLPFTKWNIRQPETGEIQRNEALESGGLDLIILPGLGFSFSSNRNEWTRLGRGKGYYDTYLEKCLKQNSPPVTIALAFKEQIVDSIPSAGHDKGVNQVFYS